MKKINYPQPEYQGKRKDQVEASATAVIVSVIILGALAVGALLWNNRHVILSFLNF